MSDIFSKLFIFPTGCERYAGRYFYVKRKIGMLEKGEIVRALENGTINYGSIDETVHPPIADWFYFRLMSDEEVERLKSIQKEKLCDLFS